MKSTKGSLTIVGSGIELVRDTTIGARIAIDRAESLNSCYESSN
jgi:hypothetical protein